MDMKGAEIVQYALLFAGVGTVLLSCAGLFVGDAFDRLHYLGPATVLAPFLIAGAVIASLSSVEAMTKSTLLAISLGLSSPVLTHATARSGFFRKIGGNHSADRKAGK
jgi:multisubunit Na+/H+ antiporter MnhG subunit